MFSTLSTSQRRNSRRSRRFSCTWHMYVYSKCTLNLKGHICFNLATLRCKKKSFLAKVGCTCNTRCTYMQVPRAICRCTMTLCVCVCVCVLRACAVQCRTEMSPIVTTDWGAWLGGLLLHSLYCYQESSHAAETLLLSRRVHHVGSIADCARKPGARSMFSACTTAHYRALLTGAPPGPGATLANIYIYIYIHMPPEITYCTIIGLAALGNYFSTPCTRTLRTSKVIYN